MGRKNTPRPCLLIFLSTLHNSAVDNIAVNGPASLPDKDMEAVVKPAGLGQRTLNNHRAVNRALVLSEEGKVFCCANTLITKTERGDWFLNRVTSTETIRYVPVAFNSVSCGTSKRYSFRFVPEVSDILTH